jgi:hypothetical protein
MRFLFASSAAALVASLALLGCDRKATTTTVAQVGGSDGGYGMPNPMPGSPIGDSGGISPITPAPSTPGTPTGAPSMPTSTPGSPTGAPTGPGSPTGTTPTPGPTGR